MKKPRARDTRLPHISIVWNTIYEKKKKKNLHQFPGCLENVALEHSESNILYIIGNVRCSVIVKSERKSFISGALCINVEI